MLISPNLKNEPRIMNPLSTNAFIKYGVLKINHPTKFNVNKIYLQSMHRFFTIAFPKFRTKFSGYHHFNENSSFFNNLLLNNMKQILTKARMHFSCIALLLFLTVLNSNAQVVDVSQCVMLSGNGGPGTTAPGSGGYGVIFGSSSTITGGVISSYHLVQTTGGANITSDIYSGGRVILANGNSVSGRITAQDRKSV